MQLAYHGKPVLNVAWVILLLAPSGLSLGRAFRPQLSFLALQLPNLNLCMLSRVQNILYSGFTGIPTENDCWK
jgi:hypothetical protein